MKTIDNWTHGAPKEDRVFGNLLDKIISKTKVDANGCLNWSGHKHNGYGRVTYKGKSLFLHRLLWSLAKEKIPKGRYLCHKCDNQACINIDHLFVGTPDDNIQDMVSKNRHYRMHKTKGICRRGHEMIPDNIYTRPNGYTNCRRCLRLNKQTEKTKNEIRRISLHAFN